MSCFLSNSSFYYERGESMKEIYTSYNCMRCRKETILFTDEVENTLKNSKYISCSHCGNKNLKHRTTTDDLRTVMNERSYKRHKGALTQRGGGNV